MDSRKLLAAVVTVGGLALIVARVAVERLDGDMPYIVGGLLCILGLMLVNGVTPRSIGFGGDKGGKVEFHPPEEDETPEPVIIDQKPLDEATQVAHEAFVRDLEMPNADAPAFTPFDPNVARALRISPSGFANTPMYLLDSSFRVLDWNEAFSLVFDRTMEGRIGESILKWTMYLKNFEEVTREGQRAFGDPANMPTFHREEIAYDSLRYGALTGIKRAYAVPGDSGETIAWLISIEVKFPDFKTKEQFDLEIVRVLENDLMWSEYALLYDRILNKTELYKDLVRQMLGESGPLQPFPERARILDLGAGTGNLAIRLMNSPQKYFVAAVENNRTMLAKLRDKTDQFHTDVFGNHGIQCIKQDITSLNGVDDNSFDGVIMNNVLYSVTDYKACLKEALRVLKPGGEIRISGPHRDSSAERLFEHIGADLKAKSEFEPLRRDFRRVRWINTYQLLPLAHKFTEDGLSETLIEIGFSEITACHFDIYAGESMLIAARK